VNKPVIALVTPALAAANNGNWQTARRWARMLAGDYHVRVTPCWSGEPADALLALHARRSAPSIAAWAAQWPRRPLVVALTGTDLYRDLPAGDTAALRSIALAQRLIVLHEGAPDDVPAAQCAKCVVCFQSSAQRQALPKSGRRLRAVMVGHLREEKDPRTAFAAMRLLADRGDIALDHVGDALDASLGAEARRLMAEQPAYRWLGGLPHGAALRRIQRAHVLLQPSAMEGGAHAVLEAVRSGTPVLASRVAGNVGMLGRGYGGYFERGDAAGCAALLLRARDDPAMLPALRAQCDERDPLFEPAREQATLRRVLSSLLENPSERP
jgi:putative glycosyltransferase (TIGR04348 family)